MLVQLRYLNINDQNKKNTPIYLKEYYLDEWSNNIQSIEMLEKPDGFVLSINNLLCVDDLVQMM